MRSTETTTGHSQNTPPENLSPGAVNAGENQSEVSPEICKAVSVKRFKFSPGMVIHFSRNCWALIMVFFFFGFGILSVFSFRIYNVCWLNAEPPPQCVQGVKLRELSLCSENKELIGD